MTIISFFGVLLALSAIPIFLRGSTLSRLAVAIALLVIHIGITQVYYIYTKTTIADAYSYYYYGAYFAQFGWSTLGTVFVGHVTQLIKKTAGASYLDCFMVFQAFGVWGLILLMRTFHEIYEKVQTKETNLPYLLLFLPSIHFWTSAVGKDGPVFFAVALSTWSVMSLRARVVPFCISVGLMVLFRAHIALAVGIAISLAALRHKDFTLGQKALLLSAAVVGTGVLFAAVRSTFNVDLTDPTSLSQFMEARGAAEASDVSSSSLGSSSFWFRLMSLLFRPFFFDAKNFFGLVASVENLGSAFMFGYLLLHFRDVRMLMKHVLVIRFSVYLSFVLICILAVLNYNVGLGLRERVMVYPPLFCLLVATSAFRKAKAIGGRGQPAAATRVGGPRAAPERLPAA